MCLTDTSTPASGTITGSYNANAFSSLQSVDIFADGNGELLDTATGSFSITAPTGMTDVYVLVYGADAMPLAANIVRGQTIPGAANVGNPITLSASDAVGLQTISIANAPAGFTAPQIGPSPFYFTANSSLPVGIGGSPAPQQYFVVPATQAQPGDYYYFEAISGTTNREVFTQQYFNTAGPVTLTFPNPWSTTPPAPATFPTFTFDYAGFSGQAAVADVSSVSWTEGSVVDSIAVYATANHQNGATTLTIPNLTGLQGSFPMAPSGTTVTWVATMWGGTAQTYLAPPPIPQTTSFVSGQGTYTEP